ncbi:MAG: sulfatase-like hydrolase/transferase [Planctomycetota bacterium]|jgi:choline-sulfatase|nr:sulfatase-like hydrolase/transferase [Planctomycetota bacterium]
MATAAQGPNILVIMSDEHDAAVTGCYGDQLVATPHLDRLAASGVTFDACYCNSPLCVPSRLSFTAGRYVSQVSAWQNSSALPSDTMPTLPHILRQAGYTPYLCGKQHYDARRRYGFEEIPVAPSHNTAHKNGRGARRVVTDQSVNAPNWHQRAAEFQPANAGGHLDHDRAVTTAACRFLRDYQTAQNPFFLFAGYLSPHFPLLAPANLVARLRGKLPQPIPARPFAEQPYNLQHHQLGFGTMAASAHDIQNGRELYWALTEWFDNEVGQLLGALANSAVADNTIVVYTSDHGENKGDHGLWWKNCLYDHAARVPLIVSWPARWAGGQRRSGACSLVDLVATIAELAGTESHESWDGDSLINYLDSDQADWKDCAISEYYGHNICSGMTMYRSGPWKYIYHARIDANHGPQRELYHMTNDPTEQINLAEDPKQAARIAELHAAMVAELGAEPDAIEQRSRAELARGYGEQPGVLAPAC